MPRMLTILYRQRRSFSLIKYIFRSYRANLEKNWLYYKPITSDRQKQQNPPQPWRLSGKFSQTARRLMQRKALNRTQPRRYSGPTARGTRCLLDRLIASLLHLWNNSDSLYCFLSPNIKPNQTPHTRRNGSATSVPVLTLSPTTMQSFYIATSTQ